jgi:hypothetical protein
VFAVFFAWLSIVISNSLVPTTPSKKAPRRAA